MADRTQARICRDEFILLANDLTDENKIKAQKLYNQNFYHGVHRDYDFHIGEMYIILELSALEIKRHPDDNYLKVRGDFQVITQP